MSGEHVATHGFSRVGDREKDEADGCEHDEHGGANAPDNTAVTFIVSNDGVVYQRDLGPNTLEAFKKMELFRRHPFHTLVALVLLFVVVATAPTIMGFLCMVVYVASGPISTYLYYRRPALPEKGEEEAPAPKPSNP